MERRRGPVVSTTPVRGQIRQHLRRGPGPAGGVFGPVSAVRPL